MEDIVMNASGCDLGERRPSINVNSKREKLKQGPFQQILAKLKQFKALSE